VGKDSKVGKRERATDEEAEIDGEKHHSACLLTWVLPEGREKQDVSRHRHDRDDGGRSSALIHPAFRSIPNV
jgi:hypothetical protein